MLAWEDLPALFPDIGDDEAWPERLQQMGDLLEEASARVRTTSDTPEAAIQRHFAESLELLRIAEEQGRQAGPFIDVGSGGGFPGLVMAAVRPGVATHLVEPLQKRARLLGEVAEALGLEHVVSHGQRAEEAGRGQLRELGGLVTARAVAELRVLIEYTAPLAAPGALIALPKGSGLADEVPAAARALAELRCEIIDTVPMRTEVSERGLVLLLRKTGNCPDRYPRRPGMPAKRPL